MSRASYHGVRSPSSFTFGGNLIRQQRGEKSDSWPHPRRQVPLLLEGALECIHMTTFR